MSLSSTSTPTTKDDRYFIESCKIFISYAISTNKIFLFISYSWKYRLNYSVCIFLVETFLTYFFCLCYCRCLLFFSNRIRDRISEKKKITDDLNADKQFLSVAFADGVCFLRDNTVNAFKGRAFPMIIRIDPLQNHHQKSHYEGIINIRHNGESVSSMHLRSHNKKNTGMRY